MATYKISILDQHALGSVCRVDPEMPAGLSRHFDEESWQRFQGLINAELRSVKAYNLRRHRLRLAAASILAVIVISGALFYLVQSEGGESVTPLLISAAAVIIISLAILLLILYFRKRNMKTAGINWENVQCVLRNYSS